VTTTPPSSALTDGSAAGRSAQPVVVHAFADRRFDGNPAAVCFVETFAQTDRLRALAAELAAPVTVFVRPTVEHELFEIRWFTQNAELDVCGHGTMAAAHWLFASGAVDGDQIEFRSRRGALWAGREEDRIWIRLPRVNSRPVDARAFAAVEAALGLQLRECRLADDDLIAILDDPEQIIALQPDLAAIRQLGCRGIAVSARVEPAGPHAEFDIVSRFFAPRIALDEDQVCASVHRGLHSYWAARLGKTAIIAWQASTGGGRLDLDASEDCVVIAGGVEIREPAKSAMRLMTQTPESCGVGVMMSEIATSALLAQRPFSMASFCVGPRCSSDPHAHDVAEIWYIAAGRGRVISEAAQFDVQRGDFVYLQPDTSHQIQNTGHEPIEAVSVWWAA